MTAASMHATGTFDVKLVPQTDPDSAVGRMTIDKVFHGDIEGASKGMTVVPDSGTDDLVGITGTLKIIIDGKKHSYEFDYTLPSGVR